MREYYALWEALKAKEKRGMTVAAHQMGELIAMVGNSGNLRFEQPLTREMFLPPMWAEPVAPKGDFDTQLRRTAEFLRRYQDGQTARGL